MKPIEQLEIVNEICDQFESEWQTGATPELETLEFWFQQQLEQQSTRFQNGSTERAESLSESKLGQQVLFELLMLDLHYRQQASIDRLASQYKAIFETHTPVVEAAIARFSRKAPKPDVASANGQKRKPLSTMIEQNLDATRLFDADSKASLETHRSESLRFDLVPQYGEFEVVRKHAEGGLGVISVARDSNFPREVALKEVRPDLPISAEMRERFVQEGQVTGQLEHPGIVPVYSLGTNASGQPFYAMRLIQGRSLRTVIGKFFKSNAAPSKQQSIVWWKKHVGRLASICDAVEYAHQQGVIHRDIKPANIMVGDFGETLLVDWGLAKFIKEKESEPEVQFDFQLADAENGDVMATREGRVVGTVSYMSPEQAKGKVSQVNSQSDIFCLGATLYSLLTGYSPYGGDKQNLMERVQHADYRPPRNVNSHIPKALEAICVKAMNAESGERYENAVQLGQDLRNWMADEPITAWKKEPMLNRLGRLSRRYRSVVAASGLFLLLSVIGLSLFARTLINKKTQITEQSQKIQQRNDEIVGLLKKTRESIYRVVLYTQNWKQFTQDEFREKNFEQILAQYDELNEAFPDDKKLDREFALARQCMGDNYARTGRFGEATKQFSEAKRLLGEQIKGFNAKDEPDLYRQYYGLLLSNAELLALTRASNITIREFEKCATAFADLLQLDSSDSEARYLLGKAKFYLAVEARRIGEFEQSLSLYDQSKTLFELVANSESESHEWRVEAELFYFVSRARYAKLLSFLGRNSDAWASFEETFSDIEIWMKKFHDNHQVAFAYSLLVAEFGTSILKVDERFGEISGEQKPNAELLQQVEAKLDKGLLVALENLSRLPDVESYQMVWCKLQQARVRLLRLTSRNVEAFQQLKEIENRLRRYGARGAFANREGLAYFGKVYLEQAEILHQQQAVLDEEVGWPFVVAFDRRGSWNPKNLKLLLRSVRNERLMQLQAVVGSLLGNNPDSRFGRQLRDASRELREEFSE